MQVESAVSFSFNENKTPSFEKDLEQQNMWFGRRNTSTVGGESSFANMPAIPNLNVLVNHETGFLNSLIGLFTSDVFPKRSEELSSKAECLISLLEAEKPIVLNKKYADYLNNHIESVTSANELIKKINQADGVLRSFVTSAVIKSDDPDNSGLLDWALLPLPEDPGARIEETKNKAVDIEENMPAKLDSLIATIESRGLVKQSENRVVTIENRRNLGYGTF
jgi:hypothetical protein